jgi:ankyrin repeat protein
MTSKSSLSRSIRSFAVDEVAATLVAAPELLHVRDERGRTWLHLCCGVDVSARDADASDASVAIAAHLVDLGLDMNDAAFTEGTWRATPVWYSVARGCNFTLTTWLLEHGADPDHSLWAAAFREDLASIDLLLDHGAAVDAVAEGETPFLGAIKVSHFESAWRLASRGANVDFQDAAGMTAFHYMLKKGSAPEHFEALASFNPSFDLADSGGRTARELLGRKREPRLRALVA